jgi:hypothetical protein
MEEVFIIDGEDENGVQTKIREYLAKVRASSKASNSMENSLVNDADSVSVGMLPGRSQANDEPQSKSIVENKGQVSIVIEVNENNNFLSPNG